MIEIHWCKKKDIWVVGKRLRRCRAQNAHKWCKRLEKRLVESTDDLLTIESRTHRRERKRQKEEISCRHRHSLRYKIRRG